MSLINKMLQDLDARGSQAGSALPPQIKPVALPERRVPGQQVAWGAGLALLVLGAAAVWWFKRPPLAPPVLASLPPGVSVAPTLPTVPGVATPVVAAPAPMPQAAVAPRAPVPVKQVAVPTAPIVKHAEAPPRVTPPASPSSGGRVMNDAQRSETLYRNALAALDDGRVAAVRDLLEQTLKLNPRHDAARQSLVALLIEAGRNDEAMQQLEQHLAIDAAQPALAMLLARMQIERGVSGVATLQRTLPAAADNGDYRAFLAGALQREQRHKDAIVQYSAALQTAPENGVWLMGLGMSLQADRRNSDALAAFQRAKASGTLSAPLLAFVERKILQLAP